MRLVLAYLFLASLFFLQLKCDDDFDIFVKLYTKENYDGTPVFIHNETLNRDYFCYLNPSFCSNFIVIHGFQSSSDASWMIEMKDELFKRNPNSNIFLVDWSKGANIGYFKYEKAAKNIRQVFPQLATLIRNKIEENFLFVNSESRTLNVHCIGHSLGAHTCGLFAKQMRSQYRVTIERITGLDPAGPCFENSDQSNRLDKSDAVYVDVIHTSNLFGILRSIGHTDFYPNAGTKQPDCWPFGLSRSEAEEPKITGSQILCNKEIQYDIVNTTEARIGSICSHSRAYEYFIESINTDCSFRALRCSSWSNYQKGLCDHCDQNRMGIKSVQMDEPIFYYLKVNSDKPFCVADPTTTAAQSSLSSSSSTRGFFTTFDTRKKTSTYKDNNICLYSSGSRTEPIFFLLASLFVSIFIFLK